MLVVKNGRRATAVDGLLSSDASSVFKDEISSGVVSVQES